MKLGEIIKNYRESNRLSLGDFGTRTGYSKTYISMLENNYNPSTKKPIVPTPITLKKCADAMNMSLNELVEKLDPDQVIDLVYVSPLPQLDNILPIKKKSFPVLGDVAAGKPIEAQQHIECYVTDDADLDADYALRVKGDSMIGAGIDDGDIVFIREQLRPPDGRQEQSLYQHAGRGHQCRVCSLPALPAVNWFLRLGAVAALSNKR